MKIFLKKEVAEKHIDLNAGDEVRFSGRVFSTALGDPWMDVDTFEVINKVKKRLKSRILLNKVWIRLWQMTIQKQ